MWSNGIVLDIRDVTFDLRLGRPIGFLDPAHVHGKPVFKKSIKT